jgi:protein-S-isoprenylcysteine O-methyltransferase Ste14
VFLLAWALEFIVPLPRISPRISTSVAGVLALAWILLMIGSFRKFWSAGTSVLPIRPTTAIVTSGPYRFTRNPMYVSLLCLYLAVACWLRLLWPVLLTPLVVWLVTRFVIAQEEQYLTRKFGAQYTAYQSRVRRWV